MTFTKSYESPDGAVLIANRNNIPWHEAPLPRYFHFCRAQTKGVTGWFNYTERCACGAVQFDGHWIQKNSRRKK